MSSVYTTKGLVDRSLLHVHDKVTETEDSRSVSTVWTLISTGEVVRQDAAVSLLRPATSSGGQAQLG